MPPVGCSQPAPEWGRDTKQHLFLGQRGHQYLPTLAPALPDSLDKATLKPAAV